jgi:hypothetical protein
LWGQCLGREGGEFLALVRFRSFSLSFVHHSDLRSHQNAVSFTPLPRSRYLDLGEGTPGKQPPSPVAAQVRRRDTCHLAPASNLCGPCQEISRIAAKCEGSTRAAPVSVRPRSRGVN